MKTIKRIFSFLSTIIIISLFIYVGYNKIKSSVFDTEYPRLKRDSSIAGIIDTFSHDLYSNPRGALYIKLSEGFKFRASVDSYNNKVSLYDFLHKGDSIYKPKGVDMLYVFRGGFRYSFKIPTQESYDSIFHKKWQQCQK